MKSDKRTYTFNGSVVDQTGVAHAVDITSEDMRAGCDELVRRCSMHAPTATKKLAVEHLSGIVEDRDIRPRTMRTKYEKSAVDGRISIIIGPTVVV